VTPGLDPAPANRKAPSVTEETEAAVVEDEPEAPEQEEPFAEEEPEASPEEPTSAPLSDDELPRAVAALIYASPEPLSERRLSALLGDAPPARVRAALDTVKARLESSNLPLELRAIAGGFQIQTASDLGPIVRRLFEDRKVERISPAALETLAIVAYRQPVTKAEIEAIRGVQAGPILRTLVDRGLVKVTGRADVPGHPLQYGTTREFLDRFGLSGPSDLPRDSELAR